MKLLSLGGLAVTSVFAGAGADAATVSSPPAVRIEARSPITSRATNLHVDYDVPVESSVAFTYGSCDSQSEQDANHAVVTRGQSSSNKSSHRLVWVLPKDLSESGGCVSAWGEDGQLLGRSEPMDVLGAMRNSRSKRHLGRRADNEDELESIEMTPEAGFDVYGPWFDGVALLEGKGGGAHVDAEAAKAKEVAIVGAGMSGLMTYLTLTQAGLTNITILEGSERLGGRIHTEYLSGGPKDYSYQEMGPMRIPATYIHDNVTYNISDQQVFFQLADELNRINAANGRDDLGINLIPFIQYSPNGLMYYNENKMENGLPPINEDIALNPSLGPTTPEIPESAVELGEELEALLPGSDYLLEMAQNLWAAHSKFISMSQTSIHIFMHGAEGPCTNLLNLRQWRPSWASRRPVV